MRKQKKNMNDNTQCSYSTKRHSKIKEEDPASQLKTEWQMYGTSRQDDMEIEMNRQDASKERMQSTVGRDGHSMTMESLRTPQESCIQGDRHVLDKWLIGRRGTVIKGLVVVKYRK